LRQLPAALLLTAPSATIPPARPREHPRARPRPPGPSTSRSPVVDRSVLAVPEVAAGGLQDNARAVVPVARELSVTDLQSVATALRDVPEAADKRVYTHHLQDALRALTNGGRR
jgi:hypothetical protein